MTEHAVRVVAVDQGASFWDDASDLAAALRSTPPEIPVRYGYDATGSDLFEEITELPHYYPTRVEQALLERHAAEIADALACDTLAELGSGSAKKTRLLLAACLQRRPTEYAPIDVSEEMLLASARALASHLPGLTVSALWGRFEAGLAWLRDAGPGGPLAVALLGSTFGGLTAGERGSLLSDVAATLRAGDRFLLAVDLDKPGEVFEACYNDPPDRSTFTRFRLNHLAHLNQRFDADFALDSFTARARYDRASSTVEGRVYATVDQAVRVRKLDVGLRFERGDSLIAGRSYKFGRAALLQELSEHGMALETQWVDTEYLYGVFLFTKD